MIIEIATGIILAAIALGVGWVVLCFCFGLFLALLEER